MVSDSKYGAARWLEARIVWHCAWRRGGGGTGWHADRISVWCRSARPSDVHDGSTPPVRRRGRGGVGSLQTSIADRSGRRLAACLIATVKFSSLAAPTGNGRITIAASTLSHAIGNDTS